jgi:hypothetical protein
VTRQLLHGTSAYKRFLTEELRPRPHYVSRYIRKEYIAGLVIPAIDLYFILSRREIATLNDAITLMRERFSIRDMKALITIAIELARMRKIDPDEPKDKPVFMRHLAMLVATFIGVFDSRFTDVGRDSTACARALVPFRLDLENISDSLMAYVRAFNDLDACRRRCHIDEFLCLRSSRVAKYVDSKDLPPRTRGDRDFRRMARLLSDAKDADCRPCKCTLCNKIGDAIIVADSLPEMEVNHIDTSFDRLCDLVDQPHRLLASAQAVHNRA